MKKIVFLLAATLSIFFIRASFVHNGSMDKAGLGKMLFFDALLSKNKTISCASCHKPDFAFADTSRVSKGVNGKKGTRNTPSTMNLSLSKSLFWDGRAKSLEEQVLAPIENRVEMNLSIDDALARLQASKTYSRYFQEIFNSEPTRSNLAEAIAAFERTLETSESAFDTWKFSDDSTAVSEAVKRGFALFNGKGKCVKCHFGSDFTTHEFRNIGLFNGRNLNDSGRAVISGNNEDVGKFKTPGLRNVSLTAPYMHNGMLKTLKAVIDFYNDPGKIVPNSINRDSVLSKPLGLTKLEKHDLEAFLNSLTDKRFNVSKGKH